MNKKDLIADVAERTDFSKKDTNLFVDEFLAAIMDALESGYKVKIMGFGNFEVRERAERKGRNPKTGEEVIIPKSFSPAWKPAKPFKELVNKGQ